MIQPKDNHFCYDSYKLSTKSCYKLTTINLNEHTKTLKLFTKDKDFLKQIKKQVKYIQGQGLDKSIAKIGGEAFTQIQNHPAEL